MLVFEKLSAFSLLLKSYRRFHVLISLPFFLTSNKIYNINANRNDRKLIDIGEMTELVHS